MITIHIEPTPELHQQRLSDGRTIPLRVWRGVTSGGVAIEAYVFSIVPTLESSHPDIDHERIQAELPDFMQLTRQTYALGDTLKDQ